VCHTFELPFVFGNAVAVLPAAPGTKLPDTRFTPAEQRLSDLMIDYWTTFAHRGRPDRPGLPDWPPFVDGRARLVFGRELSRTHDEARHCDMWDALTVRDRS
jgi:para-nitrobenzyl esterase